MSCAPSSRRRADQTVLVLNAGSSTLKASVVRPSSGEVIGSTTARWTKPEPSAAEIGRTLDDALSHLEGAARVAAAGHRVVHGGERFVAPVVLDDATIDALDELADLAPLHNPIAVATIRAARSGLPNVPHVACFDTAFHAGLPQVVRRYPVPGEWSAWGVRRYGFHGLSVEWSVARAADLLGRPANRLRLVVAHLGAGCSITAVDRGRSVWTSMGLTPLEGAMMATRAGSIDPGIVVRLLRQERLSLDELDDALERRAGLLAVGGTADMRELLEREDSGDEKARVAVEMFVDRASGAIADAATRLRAVDALVFTGGIGENAGPIRARVTRRLVAFGWRSVSARRTTTDAVLTDRQAPAVVRVAAREDVVIARATARLQGG